MQFYIEFNRKNFLAFWESIWDYNFIITFTFYLQRRFDEDS